MAGINVDSSRRYGKRSGSSSGSGAGSGSSNFQLTTIPTDRFEVSAPETVSAGAQQRGQQAREFAMSNANSAIGEAVAGGAFGDTRGALLGGAQARNRAGLDATMAANEFAESDLGRQLQAAMASQQGEMTAEQLNSQNQAAYMDYLLGKDQLKFQQDVYGDLQSRIARIMKLINEQDLSAGGGNPFQSATDDLMRQYQMIQFLSGIL